MELEFNELAKTTQSHYQAAEAAH